MSEVNGIDKAPESTLPYPPIHKDKKFVVLTDWCVASRFRGRRFAMTSNDEGTAQSRLMIPMIVGESHAEWGLAT